MDFGADIIAVLLRWMFSQSAEAIQDLLLVQISHLRCQTVRLRRAALFICS